MKIEYRKYTRDEFASVMKTSARAFHEYRSEIDIEARINLFDPDRSFVAHDGKFMVGTTRSYALDMFIPGGICPIAAVAGVTVQPTHRRKGINSKMMKLQLKDIHGRNEPLAVLQATESLIYGRYGYGMASFEHNLEIEKVHSAYGESHIPEGQMYYCEEDEARLIFPGIFDRATNNRVGMVTRNQEWWNLRFLGPFLTGFGHNGDGRTRYARYECNGANEGYVRYKVEGKVLYVIELISVTQDAYKSLWRFCLDMDLIDVIKADHRAVDEELKWIIADPRRLIEHTSDRSWVRLVDVKDALGRRKYSTDDSIIFAVEDSFLPWNNVTLQLSSSEGETACESTNKSPDIALGVSELGAVYLGGVNFSTLVHAGRVQELTNGAIERANLMFTTARKPWCFDGW